MKVLQESFTVVPDATLHEVSVLLAGMRITFNTEETRRLTSELSKALQSLGSIDTRKVTGLSDMTGDGDTRDLGAELRAAKEEMKRVSAIPRAG